MQTNPTGHPMKAEHIVLAIHGGAGAIKQELTSPEEELALREALDQALLKGWQRLQAGEGALDAVQAAVMYLEDCPLFNAGRGAVYTHNGRIELDASIMCGTTLRAGAVAGVHTIRNPVTLARAVMEQSDHVLLVGSGAEEFAEKVGVASVPESYFHTPLRWEQLQQAKNANKMMLDAVDVPRQDKFGTVGAVACDHRQQLAAATSTGGMTNKRYGRVGDSPLVGAGVYADNATCAVSATGHGEYFIRSVVSYDISAQMRYAHRSVAEASHHVIFETLKATGGGGGVIALDRQGNLACPFNTDGMYRGWVDASGIRTVYLWANR